MTACGTVQLTKPLYNYLIRKQLLYMPRSVASCEDSNIHQCQISSAADKQPSVLLMNKV